MRFQVDRQGFELRWALPMFALLGGAVCLLAGLLVWARNGPSAFAAALWVLGVAGFLCGLGALCWRIAAKLVDDVFMRSNLDDRADVATRAAIVACGLVVVTVGAQGISKDIATGRPLDGVVYAVDSEYRDGPDRVRLWVQGVPIALTWQCMFDCSPRRRLEGLGEQPGQNVRLTLIGDRIIGLQARGETVLRPGPERLRWVVGDVLVVLFGLLIAIPAAFATVRRAREARRVW